MKEKLGNLMERMSRNKFLCIVLLAVASFGLTYGAAIMSEHPGWGTSLLIPAAVLLTIVIELERMNAYDRGKRDGYRTLLTEIVENRHGMDERT